MVKDTLETRGYGRWLLSVLAACPCCQNSGISLKHGDTSEGIFLSHRLLVPHCRFSRREQIRWVLISDPSSSSSSDIQPGQGNLCAVGSRRWCQLLQVVGTSLIPPLCLWLHTFETLFNTFLRRWFFGVVRTPWGEHSHGSSGRDPNPGHPSQTAPNLRQLLVGQLGWGQDRDSHLYT